MRIATHSASSAVARTLGDLIASLGHEVAADDAELHLIDARHLPAGAPADGLAFTGPLSLRQLASQIAGRAHAPTKSWPLDHDWQFDAAARQLTHPAHSAIMLTEKECLLLRALLEIPSPAKREQLLKTVWAYDDEAETHTLETHIYRLRSKLGSAEPRPCDIVTIDGAYALVLE